MKTSEHVFLDAIKCYCRNALRSTNVITKPEIEHVDRKRNTMLQ